MRLSSFLPSFTSCQVVHHDAAGRFPRIFRHLLPKRRVFGGLGCVARPHQGCLANHRRVCRIRGPSHACSPWRGVGGARLASWQCANLLGEEMLWSTTPSCSVNMSFITSHTFTLGGENRESRMCRFVVPADQRIPSLCDQPRHLPGTLDVSGVPPPQQDRS